MKTAVIALGGNALLTSKNKGTVEEQRRNLERTCRKLTVLIKEGYDIVITHGNGPQVGNLILQNELTKEKIPPMPIDVCVSETQGQIGYLIQQILTNELSRVNIKKTVLTVITQVIVDKRDPAFRNPTKPVGSFFDKRTAKLLSKKYKWKFIEDKVRGGYRRVVPSPEPIDIVEKDAIRKLIFGGENQNEIIIASGGGGVPVVKTKTGYRGVEAVVDKDLAASVLATSINEKTFVILTDVDFVYLNFGKPESEILREVKLSTIKEYYNQGQFPPGTMGPKIKAAIKFLEKGGERVIITSIDKVLDALEGKWGTIIVNS